MIRPKFFTKKDGVPCLKDIQIEEYVENVIRDYDVSLLINPQPLNVESFTEEYFKFHLHYENLSNNGCIFGMMVFDNCKIPVYDTTTKRAEFSPINANTVVIDNSIVDGKECVFRSSVMHECGHGMYHREIFEHGNTQIIELDEYPLGIVVCRASDVVGGKKSLKTPRDWIEHHAKVFSAAILMPRYAMRIVCNDKSMRECAEKFSPEYADDVLAKRVADIFEVSEQSAKIRIKQLNLGLSKTPFRQKIFV